MLVNATHDRADAIVMRRKRLNFMGLQRVPATTIDSINRVPHLDRND